MVFKSPFFYLIIIPKLKSDDAGNSDMPKRSHKMLPLSKKVKVLDFLRKEKMWYAEIAKIYGKNKSSMHELVEKVKEVCASFDSFSDISSEGQ